jgi:hypothetical protein
LLTGIQKIKRFFAIKKMKYYSLHNSTTGIGKNFPQVQDIEFNVEKVISDSDSILRLKQDVLPDFNPNTGTIILKTGSRLTDFVSTSFISNDFLCSLRVEKIILQISYGSTKFYKVKLKHNNIISNYYRVMHTDNDYSDFINYEESDFRKIKIENNKRVNAICPVSSYDNMVKLRQEFSSNSFGEWNYLEPFSIRFNSSFQIDHDIFKIKKVTHKTFISGKLRDIFTMNSVTGIQYDFDGDHTDFFFTNE